MAKTDYTLIIETAREDGTTDEERRGGMARALAVREGTLRAMGWAPLSDAFAPPAMRTEVSVMNGRGAHVLHGTARAGDEWRMAYKAKGGCVHVKGYPTQAEAREAAEALPEGAPSMVARKGTVREIKFPS